MFFNTLIVIPARGGSKGIPKKNIKNLAGKPLIYHTINLARQFVDDKWICVSTNDLEIKQICEQYGLFVPFIRPQELAMDTSSSEDVINHAYQFYKNQNYKIDKILLLQPTSPFRKPDDIYEAMLKYNDELDMVVSVQEAEANPYFLMCLENSQGYLEKLFNNMKFSRRQDAPKVYQYNGAIYIINVKSFEKKNISSFTKVIKFNMDAISSLDIDTHLDWIFAEFILEKELFKYDFS